MTTALRTFETTRHQPLAFVSATSMGVEAEVRGIERPRIPNYVLRRLVVGTSAALIGFVMLVGLIGVLAGVGGSPAVASELASAGATASAGPIHVARSGDTMWSIADTYRGDIGRDQYIATLIRLNGDGAAIQVGQAIHLP